MKNILLIVFSFLLIHPIYGQIVDIDYRDPSALAGAPEAGVQVLKNGFVDYNTNGIIQASARVLRINIGERDKFFVPLFIYTGTSGLNLTDDVSKVKELTVNNLLNSIGGVINLSFNGQKHLYKSSSGITNFSLEFQAGIRGVNGYDSTLNKNKLFTNGIGNIGFNFQTEAWIDDANANDKGIFWIQAKLITSLSSENDYTNILGLEGKSLLFGWTLDAGIDINKVINIKLGYSKFLNLDKDGLEDNMAKISFDYSLH